MLKKIIVMYGKNKEKIVMSGLTIILSSIMYSILNQKRLMLYNLETQIDRLIPFNSAFVIFYIFWYLYTLSAFFYFSFYSEKYRNFIVTMLCAMAACYIIFILFPTYISRPLVIPDNIFNKIVSILYLFDKPYNCFPSLHVVETVIIMLYISGEKPFNKYIKVFTYIIGILIIASTLFIKQHLFLDAVSGTVLAYLVFIIVQRVLNRLDLNEHNGN